MAKKYTKGADGYYKTRVWDGTYTADGQKHYKNLRSSKSSGDLEKKVAEFQRKFQNRELILDMNVGFLEYARNYVKLYKSGKEDNTRSMYANIVEKHFCALSGVKLSQISRSHYQILINNAQGKVRTQQQIRMVFKQVLECAVMDRLLPGGFDEEFFRGLDAVKYRSASKRALYPHEKQSIFQADLDPQDRVMVYLLYGCGLRREELMALTVFDFDLRRREVKVNKAHSYTAFSQYQAAVKAPKTDNGNRSIPIPDKVFSEVERYVLYLRSVNQVYLFTMRGGKPCSKSSYDRAWARILRKLNEVSSKPISGLTAHIFRHNFCAVLCYQIPQISIKKIAELLGDSERMVLEVYNHILDEKEDASGAVNEALNF